MRAGKTPDFKLYRNEELVGYCELKSPRDDWIFEFPMDMMPGDNRVEIRRDPAAHNLADHVGKAAAQFDAVNPDRKVPNILVFVSHARLRGPSDLAMAIAGVPMPNAGVAFLLLDEQHKGNSERMWKRQKQLWDDARRIDLVVWVDAHNGSCEFIRLQGAKKLDGALKLMGLTDNVR